MEGSPWRTGGLTTATTTTSSSFTTSFSTTTSTTTSSSTSSMDPVVNGELGRHCGETEHVKELVRETEEMKLVFVVERVDRTVEWRMEAEAVRKADVPERWA